MSFKSKPSRRHRCKCRTRRVFLFLIVLCMLALVGLHIFWVLPNSGDYATLPTHTSSSSKSQSVGDPRVFIGIKTSLRGRYRERFSQIAKTWLIDALGNERIHIKFFTEAATLPSSLSEQTFGDEEGSGVLELAPYLITIPEIPPRTNHLAWKTSRLFSYFLDHYNSTVTPETWWFCSFDDDNYVLVDNLLEVLDSLQNQTDVFVGRPSVPGGFHFKGKLVHFLTGGAGYCFSRELVERGKDYFLHLPAEQMPDDMAVGYVVSGRLNVTQIFHPKFHSHLENRLRGSLPVDEIAAQVSFGYNNKQPNRGSLGAFPNVPILFPKEEDPLHFQSLRCFLLLQQGNVNVPRKCHTTPINNATY